MKAFPKIFAIGTGYIRDIFKHDVEVTEKVDGSQFAWGLVDGKLFMRSKGQVLYETNPEKMFSFGIDHIVSIQDRLPEGIIFYAEYLRIPKHNTLTYGRIPKNHLCLFGAMDLSERFESNYGQLQAYADKFEIEVVPLVYSGNIKSSDFLLGLLERESVLGDVLIEGLVVKNYEAKFLLGGQPMPLMAGKFVSEKFKEVHRGSWNKENTGKGKWETFKESFRTEARWEKAVQHLRDSGKLDNSPRDIGNLIKAVAVDIVEEEREDIIKFLFKEFGSEVVRTSTRGIAEWYKERLLKNNFE